MAKENVTIRWTEADNRYFRIFELYCDALDVAEHLQKVFDCQPAIIPR